MTQEDIERWKKNSNQKKGLFGYSSWDDYYERGIVPNIWKGITGQSSADRNADKALEESREMYEKENQWQHEKYAQDLDFANRQLQSQVDIANKNFGLQQSQFQYQKDLNELQMQREDNAIQRQVADYEAAGFSPLAAIGGNGSAAGSLNAGTAPQYDGSGIAAAAGQYLDLSRQYASLHEQLSSKYRSERQAAKFALSQMKADMQYKGMSMAEQYFNAAVNAKNKKLQNQSIEQDIETKKYANKYYSEHGYNQVTLATVLSDFLNNEDNKKTFQTFSSMFGNGLKAVADAINGIKNGDFTVTHVLGAGFKQVAAFLGNDKKNNVSFSKQENNEIMNELSKNEKDFVLDYCQKNKVSVDNLTMWDWLHIAENEADARK